MVGAGAGVRAITRQKTQHGSTAERSGVYPALHPPLPAVTTAGVVATVVVTLVDVVVVTVRVVLCVGGGGVTVGPGGRGFVVQNGGSVALVVTATRGVGGGGVGGDGGDGGALEHGLYAAGQVVPYA